MRKFMCLAMMTILLLLVGCNQTEMNEITMDTNHNPGETFLYMDTNHNPGETFLYSDEQLTEIAELADAKDALMKQYPTSCVWAELADAKDALMKQYPTSCVWSVSIVENDISNTTPGVVLYYRGETKVLQATGDGSMCR